MSNWGQVKVKLIGQEGKVVILVMSIFVSIQFKMLLLSSFGSFLNSWLTLVKFINFRGDPQPPITNQATFYLQRSSSNSANVLLYLCLSVRQ